MRFCSKCYVAITKFGIGCIKVPITFKIKRQFLNILTEDVKRNTPQKFLTTKMNIYKEIKTL